MALFVIWLGDKCVHLNHPYGKCGIDTPIYPYIKSDEAIKWGMDPKKILVLVLFYLHK